VVLARKIRAPFHPEYALGAVSESGQVTLSANARAVAGVTNEYLEAEKRYQLAEIERRQKFFRSVRRPARIRDRSVIVTDDGIATGSTMIAALQSVRAEKPHEL